MGIVIEHGAAPSTIANVAYLGARGVAEGEWNRTDAQLRAQRQAQANALANSYAQHREDINAAADSERRRIRAAVSSQERAIEAQATADEAHDNRAAAHDTAVAARAAARETAIMGRADALAGDSAASAKSRADDDHIAKGLVEWTPEQQMELMKIDKDTVAIDMDQNLTPENKEQAYRQVRRRRANLSPLPKRKPPGPTIDEEIASRTRRNEDGSVWFRQPNGNFEYRPPPKMESKSAGGDATARTAQMETKEREAQIRLENERTRLQASIEAAAVRHAEHMGMAVDASGSRLYTADQITQEVSRIYDPMRRRAGSFQEPAPTAEDLGYHWEVTRDETSGAFVPTFKRSLVKPTRPSTEAGSHMGDTLDTPANRERFGIPPASTPPSPSAPAQGPAPRTYGQFLRDREAGETFDPGMVAAAAALRSNPRDARIPGFIARAKRGDRIAQDTLDLAVIPWREPAPAPAAPAGGGVSMADIFRNATRAPEAILRSAREQVAAHARRLGISPAELMELFRKAGLGGPQGRRAVEILRRAGFDISDAEPAGGEMRQPPSAPADEARHAFGPVGL